MEVPDLKLYLTRLLSSDTSVGDRTSGYAAKMSTPGAVISGCNMYAQEKTKLWTLKTKLS